MKRLFILILACLIFLSPQGFSNFTQPGIWKPTTLTTEQQNYFQDLYQDTWNYLADHTETLTGVPHDTSKRQPTTSMTNIGLYLASVAVAYKTGLITKEDATDRTERIIKALEKIEKWRGFPRPWILVRSLNPAYGDEFTYDTHMSVLIGGLIVSKNILPNYSERITDLLTQMEFSDLYEPENGWLKGGYNVKHQNFPIYQPWGHWYYKYYASGVRLLSFYGIARKLIPETHWNDLIRPEKRMGEYTILATGPEEPGLEVQFLASLFLDERNTPIGQSQRNYIQYQIEHAKDVKAPAWGWASCQTTRGRYLTFGELRDEVVAPYASILATTYYPSEAYKNLKKLEALGARPKVDGQEKQYGFRDSVNWQSGTVVDTHLTPSQGMAFLTLANLLHNGVVWRAFMQDPTVEQGIDLLNLGVRTLPKIEHVVSDVEKPTVSKDEEDAELEAWLKENIPQS